MTSEQIGTLFTLMLQYAVPTMKIFAYTLIFSIPLGMVVAMLKMCRIKPISWLTNLYILIMRGTPLLLQLIVAQYSVPYIVKSDICPAFLRDLLGGIDIRSESYTFNMMLIAFVLNYAAYFAEIFRGGIEAIPKGQYEAAEVLGYTKTQTFMRIILPQVVKIIMPSVTNEVITLVKDTSLAFTLAYQEVFSLAKQISASQTSFMPFLIAGVFYFVANYVVDRAMIGIEKSMDYYK